MFYVINQVAFKRQDQELHKFMKNKEPIVTNLRRRMNSEPRYKATGAVAYLDEEHASQESHFKPCIHHSYGLRDAKPSNSVAGEIKPVPPPTSFLAQSHCNLQLKLSELVSSIFLLPPLSSFAFSEVLFTALLYAAFRVPPPVFLQLVTVHQTVAPSPPSGAFVLCMAAQLAEAMMTCSVLTLFY